MDDFGSAELYDDAEGLLNLKKSHHGDRQKNSLFPKRKHALHAWLNIVVTYFNLSKPHWSIIRKSSLGERIKRSPAMAANFIDRIWPTGDEILVYLIR